MGVFQSLCISSRQKAAQFVSKQVTFCQSCEDIWNVFRENWDGCMLCNWYARQTSEGWDINTEPQLFIWFSSIYHGEGETTKIKAKLLKPNRPFNSRSRREETLIDKGPQATQIKKLLFSFKNQASWQGWKSFACFLVQNEKKYWSPRQRPQIHSDILQPTSLALYHIVTKRMDRNMYLSIAPCSNTNMRITEDKNRKKAFSKILFFFGWTNCNQCFKDHKHRFHRSQVTTKSRLRPVVSCSDGS